MGVRVEMPTNQPIVLLKEVDGQRYLPVWVGAAEATAIAYAQQGVVSPRPLTHDLLRDVISALGHSVTSVRVDAVIEDVFHASLVFDNGVVVSARTSDAVALALRLAIPIETTEELLAEIGVLVQEEGEEAEDEVEKFREFLDHVTPEDFETPGEQGPRES